MKVVDCTAAIESLVGKVADEAAANLPCLGLGSRDAVRGELRALAHAAAAAANEGGQDCTGAWETDGKFVVTVQRDGGGEIDFSVALCLGKTRVKP